MGHRRPTSTSSPCDRVAELRVVDATTRRRHGAPRRRRHLRRADAPSRSPTLLPALAQAARTVGSPQIRNAGTDRRQPRHRARRPATGCRCSPRSTRSSQLARRRRRARRAVRRVHHRRRSARCCSPGELITGDHRARARRLAGLRQGRRAQRDGDRHRRRACLAVDEPRATVRLALGSVGPTIIRGAEAEALAAATRRLVDARHASADDRRAAFGALAAAARPARSTTTGPPPPTAATPIGVLAGRLLRRAFPDELTPTSTRPIGSERVYALHVNGERPRGRATPGSARACCTCCASGSA